MNRHLKSLMARPVVLLAGLLLICLPLRAQLNPQLQASPTDFLNLFQQASSVQPAPEIVTVFDFSGSMAALMFHPLYFNLDRADSGAQNNMTFALTGNSASTYVVTATIKGDTYSAGTYPNGVGTLTSTVLVQPNGSPVTAAVAAAVSPTGVLNGDTQGAADVRNWVRAASHVRFTYTGATSSGTNKGKALPVGVIRTVDIPIPWKVTNSGSTGNPLSSLTLLDQVVKLNPNGTSTTYGSGLSMEVDRCWELNAGSYVLSGGSGATTTTTLSYGGGSGMYKEAYIDWLLTGTYGAGQPYAGKYIVFDAATANLAGGQTTNISWGQGYGKSIPATATITVPQFDGSGNYLTGQDVTSAATVNVVPAFVRCQAVKRAAIQAWIQNQANVLWAFRFLDPVVEPGGSGTVTTIHNNSATNQNVAVGVPTGESEGEDGTWTVLNNTSTQGITSTTGNSVTGMKRIASLFPGNSTPLTYAVANALAQFNDPNNVFSAVETGNNTPSPCMNHFLIVFTDGVDNNNTSTNNPNGTTPYISNIGAANAAVTALGGNTTILANTSLIGRNSTYWNLFTYAGMAAHLSDPSLGMPGTGHTAAVTVAANTTAAPTSFLPFAIAGRGGVSFGSYGHRITTMTVGVSLGGFYTDTIAAQPTSPKRNLFFGAAVGDPLTTSGAISTFHSFNPTVDWIPNPADPGDFPKVGMRAPGAIYFFDGSNPDTLATDLNYALFAALSTPNINSTVPPNIPFIGTTFSNEIYMGKFIPSSGQGVLWSGDLLAFSIKTVNNQVVILDKSANPATTEDATTAIWSAQAVLANSNTFPWKGRTLLTRIPGTNAIPEHGLTSFTYTGTAFTDPTVGLTNFVGRDPNTHSVALTATQQQSVIELVAGADFTSALDSSGVPSLNRANIMGDIIDSSPAALEYKFSDVSTLIPAGLASAGNHFRLILAGTNQGWLHAFGEVTQTNPVTDATGATQNLVTGSVQELWAFLPTDFLADLDYLQVNNNIHRFMVDGAPTIYFLDLPSPTGGPGDGVVDITTPPGPERAVVLFGLGKGGRSYYAIDIHKPTLPTLLWSLVPDEASYFPATRIASGGPSLATVQTILKDMGFSTCTPAIGRVMFKGIMHDVVFFGGGYSNISVEHNFPTYPTPPPTQQTPLGRSVLALDVYTGQVLSAVDLSPANHTTPAIASGPIPAGVIPFEFFRNSGLAQRAYFLDFAGGLWSWGSKETATAAPFNGYRLDTSDLAYWTQDSGTGGVSPRLYTGSNAGIRKVAQDGSGSSALYSTLPAPFVVGTFPGMGLAAGSSIPAAAGIAMVSGDRNNPLDYNYSVTNPAPTDHRLTVYFDRQDSRDWGLDTALGPDTGISDAKLQNFSNQTNPTNPLITPGGSPSTYYLAPSVATNTDFGYYINLPLPGLYIPKGVTSPSIVSGSIFYSFFTPTTANPCTGGTGTTTTNLICNVLNPLVSDSRTNQACTSGLSANWVGIASSLTTYGTNGVIQGGAVNVVNPAPGASQTAMNLKTMFGQQQNLYPRVRVWRTIN